jgi:sulfur carrier protein
MDLIINGDKATISQASVTLAELLRLQKVEAPERVSIQVNGKFVNKTSYDSTQVHDQDEIEFLYFLGGGAL